MYAGVAHAEFIKHLIRYARVELGYHRVGVGNRGVTLAIEAQECSARNELVLAGIEEVVAQRKIVA